MERLLGWQDNHSFKESPPRVTYSLQRRIANLQWRKHRDINLINYRTDIFLHYFLIIHTFSNTTYPPHTLFPLHPPSPPASITQWSMSSFFSSLLDASIPQTPQSCQPARYIWFCLYIVCFQTDTSWCVPLRKWS